MSPVLSSIAPSLASTPSLQPSTIRAAAEPEYLARPSGFQSAVAGEGVPLGSWMLESIVAQGSRCTVYAARSSASTAGVAAARYAVKMLHPHRARESAELARFRAEARIGESARHRHLSPVLRSSLHRAPYYFVMPLLEGENTAALLEREGRLGVTQALWFVRQSAEALAALHGMGFLHGDVCPANLFVSREGHTTLLDLGSARRIDDEAGAMDRTLCGSIDSFAPELHVGLPATPQSDLYSLGISLFRMLTGRLPWRSADPGVIAAWKTSGTALEVREFVPGVPAGVSRFLRKLTSTEPLRRPASARDAVAELVELEIAALRLSPMQMGAAS